MRAREGRRGEAVNGVCERSPTGSPLQTALLVRS